MKWTPVVVAMLVGALALPPPAVVARPQEVASAPQKPEEVPTFGVGTTAVTLDVVVRAKKGRAVRTFQPFPRDPDLTRWGLDRAAAQGTTDFSSTREQTRGLVDPIPTAENTTNSASGASFSGPGAASAGAALGASAAAAALNQ